LNQALNKYSGQDILLLLSGGSALNLIDLVETKNISENYTIGVVDERFSNDPKINNYLQLREKQNFITEANKANANFLDSIPKVGESLENFTDRFLGNIQVWQEKHKQGKIITTLGMGPDGHTAGVMPHPENSKWFAETFVSSKIVAGYDAGKKNSHPLRVTLTLTFLRKHLDLAIVFVCGNDKKQALENLLSETGQLHDTPARILKEIKDCILVTDITL
jgi:6-phosphogluconolactonase/glucosamine-6-phosphate isomerase/deaminase